MTVIDTEALAGRVLHFIQEHRLMPQGEKVVVAVSGGADSVCMLHLLITLREKLSLSLHVAHLDHQLRGEESEADAAYVAELARKWELPVTVEQRDVSAYQARHRLSPEEAAREVRYRFLAEVTAAVGAEWVAVGHTLDDHIETVLMHLIRGSGTRGLRGLLPCSQFHSTGSQVAIVRPLLSLSREETAAYCRYFDLRPRLDTSNLSLSPLRNRIRQQLLPLLQQYNPQVTEALCRTAAIANEDFAFIESEACRIWGQVFKEEGNSTIISKKEFQQLDQALQRHLLRAAVEKLLGNLKDIESKHIEEVIRALDKPAGKRISLPEGLNFAIEYDRYILTPEPDALSPLPILDKEVTLRVPGETELPGWRILSHIIGRDEIRDTGNEFTACLDLAKAGHQLTLRQRRPGDRLQPLGMDQAKKLNEFMIDSKIPHSWRERIPLVCSPEHILWVVGWRIDERAKVTDSTTQVLRLEAVITADEQAG
jgi:tRNA(Ile)-lysidine synthase